MQWMKQQAEMNSGVTEAESQHVEDLYEKIGKDTFLQLSQKFYDRVYEDEQWFKDIFAGKPKDMAIRNQSEFFMQRMGGPTLYTDRKGGQTLISRHKTWRVDKPAAERWLWHMEEVIKTLDLDADVKERMMKFFKHTAYLLVAAKEVMNKKKEEHPPEVTPKGDDIILRGSSEARTPGRTSPEGRGIPMETEPSGST
mmetsp:Transcript_24349/g.60014  ORF Transcript_24349/g.60014 Transcript_24349/m.60014 type:complete len:197 (+) Transcript_24349:202-792(+)